MAFDPAKPLDDVDWAILDELQRDGRVPFSELGRRVSLSAPAVAERVRRLEQAGVITGYRAVVDPERLGASIEALVRLRVPHTKEPKFRTVLEQLPEVIDCDHVTGEDCMVVRVRTRSMKRLEQLVGTWFGEFGETTTSLVFSSVVRNRAIERAVAEADDRAGPALRAVDGDPA